MPQTLKCACPQCQCRVETGTACVRDGQLYCSQTCAYDCTETTCLCIHEFCDAAPH